MGFTIDMFPHDMISSPIFKETSKLFKLSSLIYNVTFLESINEEGNEENIFYAQRYYISNKCLS